MHGQKGFNGVAILSKRPFDEIAVRGLPGDEADQHARYIEVCVPRNGGTLRVGNLYLPNGNPVGTDRFAYKLGWMQRFAARTRELLTYEEPFLLLGDYNVIPEPIDAKNPDAWTGDALYQPETRAAYRALLNLGLTDVVRACLPGPGVYTFWDYQAGAWQKDHGIRIDPSWPPRKRPTGSSPPARQAHARLGEALRPRPRVGGRWSWIRPVPQSGPSLPPRRGGACLSAIAALGPPARTGGIPGRTLRLRREFERRVDRSGCNFCDGSALRTSEET